MKNTLLKFAISLILLNSLSACETGIFIRDSHSHYHYDNQFSSQTINWGYTTGDPVLYDMGYTGNFFPYASPYGHVVHEGDGAIVP